jgi:hypothetical protein
MDADVLGHGHVRARLKSTELAVLLSRKWHTGRAVI